MALSCIHCVVNRPPRINDGMRGILSIIGCCLIHAGYGYFYTIGNMGTYIAAYMSHMGVVITKNDIFLLTSVVIALESLAMPIGGLLYKRIGLRPLLAISCLLHVTSISVTHFTVNAIFAAVLMTYGALQGLSFGSGYSVVVFVAAQWFPLRRSLVTGLVLGSFAAGGFIFTPIQTAYINPANLKADNRTRLFSDSDLLNRIPKAFLVSGGSVALVHLIGFMLISEKKDHSPVFCLQNSDSAVQQCPGEQWELQQNDAPPTELKNVAIMQALRTLDFYLLWVCMCCIMVSTTTLSSLSKFFGLEYISDDQFLAGIAMAGSAFNAAGRVFWGLIGDYTSFKAPLCGLLAVWSALLFSFPYLSALDGSALRATYAIWICCMFFCVSGTLVFVPTGCNTLFGNKHWAVNLGAIFTACIIGAAISAGLSFLPSKPNGLKHQFLIAGVSCSIGLMSSLWLRDPKLAKPLRSLDCFVRLRVHQSWSKKSNTPTNV